MARKDHRSKINLDVDGVDPLVPYTIVGYEKMMIKLMMTLLVKCGIAKLPMMINYN